MTTSSDTTAAVFAARFEQPEPFEALLQTAWADLRQLATGRGWTRWPLYDAARPAQWCRHALLANNPPWASVAGFMLFKVDFDSYGELLRRLALMLEGYQLEQQIRELQQKLRQLYGEPEPAPWPPMGPLTPEEYWQLMTPRDTQPNPEKPDDPTTA